MAIQGAGVDGTLHLSSEVHEVADVSGAGDTMVAFIALGLAAGLPVPRAVSLANVAAGAVCETLGTATLTPAEFVVAFKRTTESGRPEKVLADRHEAAEIARQLQAGGGRVVFANGCFDLLHAGHVAMLQQARSKGDALIVALNDDDSVRRLKGSGRPVQTLEDRSAVIASLACVDFVVSFAEDTPLELILALRPAVIVKGGDYTRAEVVGGAEAAAWGGRVELIPLVEGRSTTRMLELDAG